jgi:hypothetical protein
MSASEIAKQLFDGLRNVKDVAVALAPGLKNIGADVAAEGKRLWDLGSTEFAAGFLKGYDPFVMYGPGQHAANVEQEQTGLSAILETPDHGHDSPQHDIERER